MPARNGLRDRRACGCRGARVCGHACAYVRGVGVPSSGMDNEHPETPDEVFAAAGLALGEAVLTALPGWGERVVVERAGLVHGVAGKAAGDRVAEAVAQPLAELLSADVDEQRATPLTLLRAHHGPITDLLGELGVVAQSRDDADAAAAPGDIYAVAPRSFGDFGEAVHEAGLRWGVAKAFAHRARHR